LETNDECTKMASGWPVKFAATHVGYAKITRTSPGAARVVVKTPDAADAAHIAYIALAERTPLELAHLIQKKLERML